MALPKALERFIVLPSDREKFLYGMHLCKTGIPERPKNWDMHCLSIYWDAERQLVADSGCCSAKCEVEEAIHRPTGRKVCPLTQQPCERAKMRQLVELYSILGE